MWACRGLKPMSAKTSTSVQNTLNTNAMKTLSEFSQETAALHHTAIVMCPALIVSYPNVVACLSCRVSLLSLCHVSTFAAHY